MPGIGLSWLIGWSIGFGCEDFDAAVALGVGFCMITLA